MHVNTPCLNSRPPIVPRCVYTHPCHLRTPLPAVSELARRIVVQLAGSYCILVPNVVLPNTIPVYTFVHHTDTLQMDQFKRFVACTHTHTYNLLTLAASGGARLDAAYLVSLRRLCTGNVEHEHVAS